MNKIPCRLCSVDTAWLPGWSQTLLTQMNWSWNSVRGHALSRASNLAKEFSMSLDFTGKYNINSMLFSLRRSTRLFVFQVVDSHEVRTEQIECANEKFLRKVERYLQNGTYKGMHGDPIRIYTIEVTEVEQLRSYDQEHISKSPAIYASM